MIRYTRGSALAAFPQLRDSMFADRAAQFSSRLGWDVTVDAMGCERDQYDAHDPIYMIWERPDGRHGGSMRLLPTTGPTMIEDHFSALLPDGAVASARVWECTRFCVAPGAAPGISAALMLGVLEFGLGLGLSHLAGVFDGRMVPVYRRLGWSPRVLGRTDPGRDAICAGLWSIDRDVRPVLLRKAGVSSAVAAHWFRRGFGKPGLVLAA